MSAVESWNGAGGLGEHRTVGYRAWCHRCADWCSPASICLCCDCERLPVQWRGLNPGEVLEELRTDAMNLAAYKIDGDSAVYVRLRDVIDMLYGGAAMEVPTITDLSKFPNARLHMDCMEDNCLVGDNECRKHWWRTGR